VIYAEENGSVKRQPKDDSDDSPDAGNGTTRTSADVVRSPMLTISSDTDNAYSRK